MFKGLDQRKFNLKFQTEDNCRKFLYKMKWRKGFCCSRCGNKTSWKGRTEFHKRCRSCDYDESVTANTIFHKLQIPLVKAFSIVYYVTAFKKGVSCRTLSKTVCVSVNSVWQFRQKLQKAMANCVLAQTSKNQHVKHCSVDGIILTKRGKDLNGLQKVKLTLYKSGLGSKCKSIRCTVSSTESNNINQCTLVSGRYVDEGKDMLMWNFRVWITGIHHHCAEKYLNGYLNEYCFRFNHRNNESSMWRTLLSHTIISNSPILKVHGA